MKSTHALKQIVCSAVVFALLTSLPVHTHAKDAVNSFGGKIVKVVDKKSKAITCASEGELLVLNSNIGGFAQAAGAGSQMRFPDAAQGVFDSIPFFAHDPAKHPRKGAYVLGKAESSVDMKKCFIKIGKTKIPIPVYVVTKYNVSESASTK